MTFLFHIGTILRGKQAIGWAIKRSLDARNYSVYFNQDERTEEYFTVELESAIEECKDFVLVITTGYMDRLMENAEDDWICAEVKLAHEKKKHFVPILIDGVSLPERKELWPSELSFLHYANYVSCKGAGTFPNSTCRYTGKEAEFTSG